MPYEVYDASNRTDIYNSEPGGVGSWDLDFWARGPSCVGVRETADLHTLGSIGTTDRPPSRPIQVKTSHGTVVRGSNRLIHDGLWDKIGEGVTR